MLNSAVFESCAFTNGELDTVAKSGAEFVSHSDTLGNSSGKSIPECESDAVAEPDKIAIGKLDSITYDTTAGVANAVDKAYTTFLLLQPYSGRRKTNKAFKLLL